MKRILNFLSVCTIVFSVLFISCKGDEGPTGPQGEKGDIGAAGTNGTNGKEGVNGKDGADGVANINSWTAKVSPSEWQEESVFGGIGDQGATRWGAASISDPKISNDYIIIPFLQWNGQSIAMPISNFDLAEKSGVYFQYGVTAGKLALYYRKTDLNDKVTSMKPSTDITFEIVRIQKKTALKMKEAGVNMKNLDAVRNFAK